MAGNRGKLIGTVVVALLVVGACTPFVPPPHAHQPTLSAEVVRETEVGGFYRQGVARVHDGWIFSFNDGFFVTDDHFVQTKQLAPAIPAAWKAFGFDHIGDIDVQDGVLYAPLEQPDYSRGYQAMLTYDAATLTYTGGRLVSQHHNSFVTVDANGIAYSMDAFGGDALLRYDTRDDWRPLRALSMSSFVDRVQGGDIARSAAWLSTDDAIDGVYRVDLRTGAVEALGSIGHVDGEGEGIDATQLPDQTDLHVLGVDVKLLPVRLIDLRVTPRPAH